jgi:GNAT superfamily N-acetyltransferase
MITIRKTEKQDIRQLAEIYKSAYDRPQFGEDWSLERAENLLNFYFNLDTFIGLTATSNERIVGGFFSFTKPWYDGNRLAEGELFVDPQYQNQKIGSRLMLQMMKEAEEKGCLIHELIAYDEVAKWYRSLGMKDSGLHHMEGNIKEIEQNLKSKNAELK